MKNEQSNSIVISPNGMFSCYQISDRDSFDKDNPFISYFYIPSTLDNAFNAKLIVNVQAFRAYSKTAKGGGGIKKSSEGGGAVTKSSGDGGYLSKSTGDGGYVSKTTGDGGYASKTSGGSGEIKINLSGVTNSAGYTYVSGTGSVNSTTGEAFSSGGRTTGVPNGAINGEAGNIDMNTHTHWVKLTHSHGISVDCGDHTHGLTLKGSASADDHKHTFEIPDHKHTFTVPNHQHTFEVPNHTHEIKLDAHTHEIRLDDHTHEAVYGIYEHNVIPDCGIYINGKLYKNLTNNNKEQQYEFDITSDFKGLQSGINKLEFRTSGLCRVSFTMFWGGYYEYE